MRIRPAMTPMTLAAVGAACATGSALANQGVSPDGLWAVLPETPAQVLALEPFIRPTRYTPVSLQIGPMTQILSTAPVEFSPDARQRQTRITIPLPDGTFAEFSVVQTPVLDPVLAAQFPNIRTYSGRRTDDPFTTVRLDLTDFGFRAQIRSIGETYYIDPVSFGDTVHYASYARSTYRPRGLQGFGQFTCHVSPTSVKTGLGAGALGGPDSEIDNFGTQIRQYRLAVSATGEFTAFYGGTVSGGLSGITTIVNRVSGVYEDDLAARFQLVASNNLIVFTNAATDPFDDFNVNQMLSVNQGVVDGAIGSANYDVGHVFGRNGGGGIANLSSVCTANKARGVSALNPPSGDVFSIDYVAHEIGHQFAGNHTFNNCSGGPATGNPNSPVEPGSGVTVMAYAGICGSNNIASNSIAAFHAFSIFSEMRPFIAGGNGSLCGTLINTGNGVPTITASPASFVIPARTPFTLSVSATDPNGDPLLYSFEQINASTTGVAIQPNGSVPDNGVNPLIRSVLPNANNFRTIPNPPNLLANTIFRGESLPTTSRTLTFRAIVRDSNGGVNSVLLSVQSVANTAGFAVTSPNTAVTWQGGLPQTITWNVSNSASSPVNASNVRIDLSTDGGLTFPINLAASVPNTGSASVTIPNTPTTQARIRVSAVGNIFFDVSNANFTITPAFCYPNCDNSTTNPLLTPADLVCFLTRFRLGDPYANCDESTGFPELTPADFVCFLNLFRQGCP